MSFDIYGNTLRSGHCEVHPHVHEEYPCSVCIAEASQREQQQRPPYCDGDPRFCESAHYLAQASEHIKDQERTMATQQARIEALEEVPAIVCVVAALQAYGYTIPSGWVLPTTHKSPYWEQCWRKALLEGE